MDCWALLFTWTWVLAVSWLFYHFHYLFAREFKQIHRVCFSNEDLQLLVFQCTSAETATNPYILLDLFFQQSHSLINVNLLYSGEIMWTFSISFFCTSLHFAIAATIIISLTEKVINRRQKTTVILTAMTPINPPMNYFLTTCYLVQKENSMILISPQSSLDTIKI